MTTPYRDVLYLRRWMTNCAARIPVKHGRLRQCWWGARDETLATLSTLFTEDTLMFGATLVDYTPAESEPDFLECPWPDGPDEWLSPLARADDGDEDEEEEDEDEEEEDEDLDEDFDDEDFDDEDFDDEDFDDEDLDDLDEDLDDLDEDEDDDEDEEDEEEKPGDED